MKTERKKLIERLRLDYTASTMALTLMHQAADMLEADSEPKCSDQAPQPQRPLPTAVEALAADAARYRWLREAAQAVIDRWDTPLWKDVPATAEYIGRLRAALGEKP